MNDNPDLVKRIAELEDWAAFLHKQVSDNDFYILEQNRLLGIKDKRIAELQQIVARIVEHNDIDSDVPEYIRWEILVADARKVIEDNVADWEAHYRDLGEKDR